MMTLTPAKLLGIDAEKGSIVEWEDLDLVIFDNDINIELVMRMEDIHVGESWVVKETCKRKL